MLDPPFRQPPILDESRLLTRAGGAVDEVSITLRIFGDDLNPNELTMLLGLEPTSSCRKADIFRGKHYDRIEKTGRWLLERDHVADNVDNVVKQMLFDLPQEHALWDTLHERFKVDLYLGIWMRDWNRGFTLLPETLLLLANRKLEIGFDIYCDVSQPELEFQIIKERPSEDSYS